MPGFPVEIRGVDELHAALLGRAADVAIASTTK